MLHVATPEGFLALLGGFPGRGPLDLGVFEERDVEGCICTLVEYTTHGSTRVPAYLLVPKDRNGDGRLPGVVALHQDGNRTTRAIGKSELLGLVGDADQHYAPELCRHGYVVLCPDRRGFEAREGQPAEPPGLAGELFELHRAVDALQAQPEVDGGRIAAIGHSAGGWMATMLMFTDARVRAAAISNAIWLWHWALLPPDLRLPGRVPKPDQPGLGTLIDQDDFLAGIAPRPYLHARGHPWPAAFEEELTRKARARYAAMEVPERFEWMGYEGEHTFPPDRRAIAYAWLDRWLKEAP